MNNAELFKRIFGIYAEEFWAYPKEKMLDWLTSNVPDTNVEDLISRQAAIDALIAEGRNVDSRYLESERIIHESDAVEAISLLPSAQQWIPVTERLPKPNKKENNCLVYYLVQNEYGDMMVAAYRANVNGETWWEQMYAYKPVQDEVIAWMPLPELYRKETEDVKVH